MYPQSQLPRLLLLIPTLMICLCLTGCGSGKITKENANKISTGMTEKEVIAVLGEPTVNQQTTMPKVGGMEIGGSMRQCVWKSGNRTITVQFMGGKVVSKMTTGL